MSDHMIDIPSRDVFAYAITRRILEHICDMVRGETRKSLPDLIYQAIAEYDQARIREAEFLKGEITRLVNLMPGVMVASYNVTITDDLKSTPNAKEPT